MCLGVAVGVGVGDTVGVGDGIGVGVGVGVIDGLCTAAISHRPKILAVP